MIISCVPHIRYLHCAMEPVVLMYVYILYVILKKFWEQYYPRSIRISRVYPSQCNPRLFKNLFYQNSNQLNSSVDLFSDPKLLKFRKCIMRISHITWKLKICVVYMLKEQDKYRTYHNVKQIHEKNKMALTFFAFCMYVDVIMLLSRTNQGFIFK